MKREQKVKPVDENGVYISGSLKDWKVKNPKSLFFHSPFEWRCWIKLKKRDWKFSCQPESIEMIPAFKTVSFVKGKIVTAKVQDAVYTPDFLINTKFGDVYIECKGFFRPADRIRFKLCQYTLKQKENKVILLILNDIQFDKMLSLIDAEFNFQKIKKLEL
jgi:predicted nuclease of restriction endonuclease-like RecB superfamily